MYIERAKLMEYPIRLDHYDKEHGNEHFVFGIESVLEYAKDLPAADVVPVVRGEWVLYGNDDDCGSSYFCSRCGANYDEDWFYRYGEYVPFKNCPNCGARMDGGSDG